MYHSIVMEVKTRLYGIAVCASFLFFGLLCATPAQAAITYVGGNGNVGNSAAFNVSLTALTSGSGSTALAGDLVLVLSAIGGTTNGNPGVSTSGFTEEQDLYADDSNDANLSVSWKFMTGTPDTTVSCNGSGSATVGAACIVHVYRGVDSSSPFDVAETIATAINSAIPNPASITPTTAGAVVVVFGAGALATADTTVTAPTGYIKQVNLSTDPGSAIISAVAYKAWSGSGAEDPDAWTGWDSGTAGSWAAVTMALRPSPIVSFTGTLYIDEGVTPMSGSTIKMAIGTTTPGILATTTNASGVWSINNVLVTGASAGTPVVVWVDGDDTFKATLFTKLASITSNLSGLNLYRNNVIVRDEGSTDITGDDMDFYDGYNETDIGYVVNERTDTLYLGSDQQLFVWAGDTFIGATTTVIAGDIENNGGTIDFSEKSTLLAATGELTGSVPSLGDVTVGSTTGTVVVNDAVTWTAYPATDTVAWQSVTYGNGLFVAVSITGTNRVMTSPDGITWTARNAAEANQWNSVTYGNGQFVAVAGSGTNRVMTSPDGITWTARAAAQANNWLNVTYGGGLFVATSFDGTNRVMTSPDGITWTARTAAQANSWRSVTYGNGLYVAVSDGGTNRVMTSPDGITWTARTAAQANQWYSVTFGNGLFVAVAGNGTNRVMTSTDGITWTARNATEANLWYSVAYYNGLFVAIAADGTNRVMTSPDGITWTARAAGAANAWRGIAFGEGIIVAVADSGTNRVMMSDSGTLFEIDPYKNDGLEWTISTTTETNQWYGLAYGEGLFVAVSADGTNRVMTSPDGITWTARTAAQANQWIDVTYGNGQFVAVANTGTNRVMTSPDGITWTARTASEANGWLGVTYGEGLFVAVANSGTNRVMTSPDGITWTARSAAQQNFWYDVAYGNGIFVAVGELDAGTHQVMTSANGITWTARSAAGENAWQNITFGDGIFVSVALNSNTTDSIMTSPDGITWTIQSSPAAAFWSDVVYADGVFVAVGAQYIMVSSDAITWRLTDAPNLLYIAAETLAYGDGRIVFVYEDSAYVSTSGGNEVVYTFSSNASTGDLTIASDGHLVAPAELTINGDYINNGTFAAGVGLVILDTAGTGGTGYDLAGEAYDSVSMSIADAGPGGLHFRSDGLKMYTNGWGSDLVREFTLSSAWDLSSASQAATYSVVAQDTWTGDVTFNDTGTKMYVTSDTSDVVLEYALSTPWSIASGVTYTDSISIAAKETSPHGVEFSADGTKMYVSGSASDAVHTYSLSTPWDASTASFLRSYSVRAQDSTTNGISFSSDGTVMVMVGSFTSLGYKYTLSTPWEVSTSSITYTGDTIDFTLRSEFEPMQTAFSEDGTKLFMYGYNTGDVFQYTTGVAGTGTPDTDKELSGAMTGVSAFADLSVVPTGESTVTFLDDAEMNDVEFGAGAQVTAPPVLTLNGNFSNNGVFISNGGVIDVTSTTTFTGNLTGDSELGALEANSVAIPSAAIWTSRTATANSWSDVTYGNGLFVAVSTDGTNLAMSSPDGITWTDRTAAGDNDLWDAVTYGNGLFVAVGNATGGADPIMTSPDGITWTARTAPVVGEWSALTYGNGVFVALSRSGQIMSSSNGTAWTQRTSPAAVNWIDVAYGTLFVAVAQEGNVITSPDGITWTSRTPAEMNDWTSVAYGNGTYVVVGDAVTNRGMTSPDGINWTARDIGDDTWADLIFADGIFVATVLNALTGNIDVHTSSDGITWNMQTNPAGFWTSLAYGNGTFVAIAGLPFFEGVAMSAPGSGVISTGITFGGNASTTDITLNEFTSLSAPGILTISDDFTNNGTFIHNEGLVYFDAATAQTISGTTSTVFNDVVFTGSGNKTFTSNATTSDFTIASGATVAAPDSLTITGDYTNNGTFTKGSGVVYVEGVLSETTIITDAYDTSTAVVDGAPFSITAQETNPVGFAFSSDGTKMYITGYDSDAVSQYALSTAWDVTSASVDGSPFSVSSQDAFFEDIEFKPDGTKMYLLGSGNDRVYAYTLSSPWEISSASYDTAFATVNQDTNPFDIAFSPDGTRMYMVGATNDRVYSYTLSSAWVITSATYDSASYLISGQETSPEGLALSPDGTRMYVVGVAGDDVNQYALGTPWNVTTATVEGTPYSVAAEETEPTEIAFNDDGTKMFIVGSQANEINAYTLGSIAPSTSGTTTLSGNMTGTSAFNDLQLSSATELINDGITWTARTAAEANTWVSVTYGNGLFVAVANSGTNRVMTSPDGITWTARTAAEANTWVSVTYGNGLFVAVAGSGTNRVMTSPDGITWTARTAAQANSWSSITYGNELFVAVAYSGTDRVMTSPDGTTWTARNALDTDLWFSVTYGNGLFVAVGGGISNRVMTSPDGITWTARTAAQANSWQSVTYGNNLFVAVSNDGTNRVMTSPDGITWTARTAAQANSWSSVAYVNELFVAVSIDGTNRVMTSPDGITWTVRSASEANQWASVVHGEGVLVAVSITGTNRVMTSQSGTTIEGAVVFASNASTTDLTITSGSNVITPALLSIAGDYQNNGQVEFGTGTTTFNGTTAQTINGTLSGTSAFNNVHVINTVGTTSFEAAFTANNLTATSGVIIEFPAGATSTIASFDVVGTDGNEVILRSTLNGTQWGINAAAHDVSYADIKDSTACPSSSDLSAANSLDSGNNLCWTITGPVAGPAEISSASNQVFQIGQATTSIATITITDAEIPAITAANDIRIAIASSTVNMKWDTTDTTAIIGGTASAKVSTSVSYAGNGSVLIIPVESNFAANDTLTVSGLSFAQFGALRTATSGLQILTDGASDTVANDRDDKTITITGSFTVANHDAGQASDAFSHQNLTATPLYRFKITPAGESATVSTMTFNLNGVRKINSTKLSNLQLYRDINNNGTYNAGDVQIGGAGVLTIVGQAGSIVFSTPFSATTSQNYIMVGNVSGIMQNEYMTVSLNVSGSVTGATTLANITPSGSVTSVQHIRGGDAGGASAVLEIGGSAPAGSGTQTGGSEGGGSGIGNSNNGQTIGNEPGFKAPTATGEGFNEWTNGSGALLSDGVYATAASTNLRQSYGVFGFNVPTGNIVQGIEVKLEASGSTGAGTIQVALSWNGGSTITETKATSVLTNTDAVYTLGGPSDKWGRSWTPAEFSNANFFVRVIGQPNQNTVRVDAIQVHPYSYAGGGGGGAGGEI